MMTVLVIVLIVVAANVLIYMLFHGSDVRSVNDRIRIQEDEEQMRAVSKK